MRINDFLLGLVMALLGAVTIWGSRNFPSMPRQDYGAGTFPSLIGAGLVLLGLLLAIRGWPQRRQWLVWQASVAMPRTLLCLVVVIVSMMAYVLLVPVLGFPMVSVVLLTLLIGWLSGGRWWLAGIVAGTATMVIWLAFAELLRVPLGLGILHGVIY